MKKSIFAAVLGFGVVAAMSSYGQGYVAFNNYYASTQTTGVSYADGPDVGMMVGPEISAQLYYYQGVTASFSALTALDYTSGGNTSIVPFGLGIASGPGQPGAGIFNGGAVLVPGTAGATYTFDVVFSGTLNGVAYNGDSGLFQLATQSSSTAPIPNLPTSIQQGNFTVTSVPEPTTMALGGLGLAALTLLRRKRA